MAVHTTNVTCESSEGGDPKKAMREMFGLGAVDQQIRTAISTCWMMLPEDKRSPENVAREVRRIMERALANIADDAAAFGFGGEGQAAPEA